MNRSTLLWAALLGAALLVALVLPTSFWTGLPDLCPFHRWTGLPCPTCGLTRSWSALMHGDLASSFRYHLLGPPLVLGLALWSAWGLRTAKVPTLPRPLAWTLALVWSGHALGRMAGWLS